MKEEIPIYSQGEIKVTNLRAVFGEKTYAISNISAVETETVAPSSFGGALLAIGILMVIFAIPSFLPSQNALQSGPKVTLLLLGLLLLVAGFLSMRAAKSSYTVKISTSSGEVKAYTSDNKELIKNIVESVNQAIIQKG